MGNLILLSIKILCFVIYKYKVREIFLIYIQLIGTYLNKQFIPINLIVPFMLTLKTKNYVLFVFVAQLMFIHIFTHLSMTCLFLQLG